jgi:hypothetical protein
MAKEKEFNTLDAKAVSEVFFKGNYHWETIYKQVRGQYTLTPQVAAAVDIYQSVMVTVETTQEQLMQQAAKRFRELGKEDFEQLQSSREGFAFVSQENPAVEAAEGIDLTPEHKAINNISARMGVEL